MFTLCGTFLSEISQKVNVTSRGYAVPSSSSAIHDYMMDLDLVLFVNNTKLLREFIYEHKSLLAVNKT